MLTEFRQGLVALRCDEIAKGKEAGCCADAEAKCGDCDNDFKMRHHEASTKLVEKFAKDQTGEECK